MIETEKNKGGRPKKAYKALNLSLRTDLYERLEETSKEQGTSRTALIEWMLEIYFDLSDDLARKDEALGEAPGG